MVLFQSTFPSSNVKRTMKDETLFDTAVFLRDVCGFSEGPGLPYQMHIQTAGLSAGPPGQAELTVYCVHDVSDFRSQVSFFSTLLSARQQCNFPRIHLPAGAGTW